MIGLSRRIATGMERNQPIFKLLDLKYPREGHHNVYVIKLDAKVLQELRFANVNRDHDGTKPCVYVGMTGIKPEERFEKHKQGHKAAYYVFKYGEILLERFYKFLNPMNYETAKSVEIVVASLLRKQGFAVWQN
jgi:predicted GIY-YIG superfamily endonuclease